MDLFKEILDTKTSSSSPRVRRQMADLATAVVKENWDKEHPGCVKVEYILGADGAKTSDWIRVLHGYAGKGFGSYALPEIGSEVLVGFIMGDMENAVVLGCLHNSENPLPEKTANEKNTVKEIRTKGGYELTISEEKGKEKLSVKTPGEQILTIDDENQKIEVQDKQGKEKILIDGKTNSVSITGDKKIELASKSAKLLLDGGANKIELTASQISINGKQMAELKGQSLKLEGTSVELKAKGTMKAEASGIAQLKGAMVKIN